MSTNDIHAVEPGWKVKTADADELGTVQEVTDRHILVKSGLINAEHRYLPLACLAHVQPELKEIGISMTSAEIDEGDWAVPPTEGPRSEGAPLNLDSDDEIEDAMRAGTEVDPEHPATS